MLDVVEAIDGGEPAITCAEIRRRSSAGGLPAREYPKPGSIQVLMDRADVAWRAELAATTIGDLALQVARSVSPTAAIKAATWYQNVTRRTRT